MQQKDVDVFRAQLLSKLVDLRSGIARSGRAVLCHQLVGVAWDGLQRDREHLRHAVIAFGRLEKADATIVRVPHEPCELLLPKLTLDPAAVSAGSEGESRHLDF